MLVHHRCYTGCSDRLRVFGAVGCPRARKAIEAGRNKVVLQFVTVKPGDFIYLPAGQIHAMGPGILLYELQQTSDTTYRVYDWDRLGFDGSRAICTWKKPCNASILP